MTSQTDTKVVVSPFCFNGWCISRVLGMARSDNQLSLITKALTGSLYHIYITQMVVHTKSNSKLSMTGFFLLSAFFCFPIVHTVNKDTHSSCHTSNKIHQSWELYKNAETAAVFTSLIDILCSKHAQ